MAAISITGVSGLDQKRVRQAGYLRAWRVMLVCLQTAFRKIKTCITLLAIQIVLDPGMQTLSSQMSDVGFDVSFNKAGQVYGAQVRPMEGEILNKRPVFLN